MVLHNLSVSNAICFVGIVKIVFNDGYLLCTKSVLIILECITIFSIFLLFQATRSVCVSVEVSASQGKAPAIAVSRPAVLGQSGRPSRH